MDKPKVLVLMSTYNGAIFLKEQLDSILNQEDVNVELLIRDDGSTDSTKFILKEYENYPNCTIVYGNNIGASNSFLWLLENCGKSDYYSFSDQDDIWINDKLITAVYALIKNKADLYHGHAGRVTKDLHPLPNDNYVPRNCFGASLMSSATGCTMVLTKQLMDKLKTYVPKNISMHDAWVYRVTYAIGAKVYYDEKSHILYRQHDHNVSGGQMSLKDKIIKIKKNKGLKYHLAEEIKLGFINTIPDANLSILTQYLNYKKSFIDKLKVLFSSNYNVNSVKTNIINKFLFVLNLI